jgi:hypothetical protein
LAFVLIGGRQRGRGIAAENGTGVGDCCRWWKVFICGLAIIGFKQVSRRIKGKVQVRCILS